MKIAVKNYKNYIIHSEDGNQKGIFFRSPLQKVYFDTYNCGDYRFSAYRYSRNLTFIRIIYEYLIGNGYIVKNIFKWIDEIEFGGFYGNILCSPIYFNRNYRKLTAHSSSDSDNIQSIKAYGYESQFNECAGKCTVERTKIRLKNGKTVRIKIRDEYHNTYSHIIEGIINSGDINH